MFHRETGCYGPHYWASPNNHPDSKLRHSSALAYPQLSNAERLLLKFAYCIESEPDLRYSNERELPDA
jgi:hypothetical protein